MDRLIITYALIRCWGEGVNHLDCFWPFPLKVMPTDKKPVELTEVKQGIKTRFDLDIPLHSLRTILRRAETKQYLNRVSSRYALTDKAIEYLRHIESESDVERRMNALYADIQQFVKQRFGAAPPEAEIEKMVYSLISKNLEPLVEFFESDTGARRPVDLDIRTKLGYSLTEYIETADKEKPEHYKTIHDILLGALLSTALGAKDMSRVFSVNARRFRGCKLFLDSNFVFSMLGLHEKEFNEAGVPAPCITKGWKRETTGKWSPKAIRDIARSKQLIGQFYWKGKLYLEEDKLRILTDAEWQALQKRLDENRERRYYNAVKYDYPPLKKMVFHSCGQLMYAKPEKGKPRYYCPKCRRSSIGAQKLWLEIQQGIKDELLDDARLKPNLRAQFNNQDTIDQLEKAIRNADGQIKTLENHKDAAFRMGLTLNNYPIERVQVEIDKAEQNIQHLKREKAELENRLSTIKEQRLDEEGIKRFCQLVAKNLNSLTKGQWEILLKLLRFRITVYSRELAVVDVALSPVRKSEIELSRL